jgi:hypothetical protein
MPSIFILKVSGPFSHTVKNISYYAGSNWYLEDYGSHSKSAMYMDQTTLSDDGLLYDIQWMPSNWVGPYILEQSHVPYALIRVVEWGMLERIGNWMRFTTKYDVPVEHRELIWKQIKELEEEPCLINIAMGMVPVKSSPQQTSPKRFHQKRMTDVQMHV